MLRRSVILLFVLLGFQTYGQISFFTASDSLNKGRFWGVNAAVGGLWTGSMVGLSQVWYTNEKTTWHSFDDSRNWMQMDKVGHFYTANKISTLTGDLYHWSGLSNKSSAWIGFGVGMGYQLTLEMLDAYSPEWGFSWSDVGANTMGSILYLGQQLGWEEQRILLKFSTHPSPYAHYRPEILGSNFAERLLKDYNGQTYWLSISPGTFGQNSFPKWLCFSLGYSIDQKLVGDLDYFDYQENGQAAQFHAQRQFLLSLDVDFSRIPAKRPWARTLLKQLNYLKVPFPALILTGDQLGGHLLYF